MKKLWQKNWEMDKTIESFETNDDLLMDKKLIRADVYGSIAQAKMLKKINILSSDELVLALNGLNKILLLTEKDEFELLPGDEDVHTKIENFLTAECGEVGKKIHTGRSRNDQVLTALRLYSKEMILKIWEAEIDLHKSFLVFAKKYPLLPMPGYTHMQKAMPSTVEMWALSFVESLQDDLMLLEQSYKLNDKCPLGSAAGYGVPLSIDRQYLADILGFKAVQLSPIYCQGSRGKIEASIIASLNSSLMTINKFATDILFFTTSECHYFDVADQLCSGSSIMPQKKNVDIAELLRSKTHILTGNYVKISSISSNLISGYNRDLQETKKILIESLALVLESIKVATILVNNITPNKNNLNQALTAELFATHNALDLVREGVSFRRAYQQVDLNRIFHKPNDVVASLKQSIHLGGAGNLAIEKYKNFIKKMNKKFHLENEKYEKVLTNLFKKE